MPEDAARLVSNEMTYSLVDGLGPSGVQETASGIKADVSRVSKTTTTGLYRHFGKRFLDIIVVLALAPVVLVVVAIVWIVTILDGGRGIYGQERVGRDGKIFRCWKIRTMVSDADRALARLIRKDADIAEEWQKNQKLAEDPRITRWGRILRRTSLDELPQFWNVLVGDMSLIGPRPFTPDQKPFYDKTRTTDAYYRLRPGVSGLWQVKCRNNGGFSDRVVFDDSYGRDLSLLGDMMIALRTIVVVMKATGR